MDSISQFALGAAIGVAVMGRRTSAWKAALWGGACGTLPDMDVLIDHGDAIRNMTLHRTESHSLFYVSLLSPLIAWLAKRIHGAGGNSAGANAAGASFGRWWLLAWLALFTHPLLDWMTIYGTQFALPFTDFPFALGSIFVIDPLYTLPLIVGVLAAVSASDQRTGRGLRWNLLGLALSTGYLAWSVAAQQHVTAIAETAIREQGIQAQRLLVIPTPFNTLLWRVLAIEQDSYAEGYYSLLAPDRSIPLERYPRGASLYQASKDDRHVNRIAWFSHGFFAMQRKDGLLLISDLRMGQEPSYTFTFSIPEAAPQGSSQSSSQNGPAARPALVPQQYQLRAGFAWLWRRIRGEPIPYPG